MTAAPFSHAQSEEHVAEVPVAVANAGGFERNVRKRARMMRELESLNEDNAGIRWRFGARYRLSFHAMTTLRTSM